MSPDLGALRNSTHSSAFSALCITWERCGKGKARGGLSCGLCFNVFPRHGWEVKNVSALFIVVVVVVAPSQAKFLEASSFLPSLRYRLFEQCPETPCGVCFIN